MPPRAPAPPLPPPHQSRRLLCPDSPSPTTSPSAPGRLISPSRASCCQPDPDAAPGPNIRVYRDCTFPAPVSGCIRQRKSAVRNSTKVGWNRGNAPARWPEHRTLAKPPMEQIISQACDAVLYGYQPMEIIFGGRSAACGMLDVSRSRQVLRFDGKTSFLRFKLRQPDPRRLLPSAVSAATRARMRPETNPCKASEGPLNASWPIVFQEGRGQVLAVVHRRKFGSMYRVLKLPRTAPPEQARRHARHTGQADAPTAWPVVATTAPVELPGGRQQGRTRPTPLQAAGDVLPLGSEHRAHRYQSNDRGDQGASRIRRGRFARRSDAEIICAAVDQLIRWTVELNWPAPNRRFEDVGQQAQDAPQPRPA